MIKLKNLCGIVALIAVFQSSAVAQQSVTVYGDDNYKPYSFEEKGVAKGIYVDILEEAFSQIPDYNVEIKMLPWKRGIRNVKNGKSIALFPPYFAEKRLPWMLFSEPILKEQVVVFGKEENLSGKVKWPEDFEGSTIGLNRGFNPFSMGGDAFGNATEEGKIKIEEADDNEQLLKQVELDRIDYYINDRLIDINKFPTIKRGIVANTNFGYLGFTRQSEGYAYLEDFKRKFDAVIVRMKNTGRIERLVEQYIESL